MEAGIIKVDRKEGGDDGGDFIRHAAATPPVTVPAGHVGPIVLPGTGRLVWWTGRVAIGLRHEAPRRHEPMSESALWLQDLMLDPKRLKAA